MASELLVGSWRKHLLTYQEFTHSSPVTRRSPRVFRCALSDQSWSGRSGYVTDAFVEDFDTCRGYSGYLCGPPAMVDAGVKAFKRRRMAPRRIFREKFTPAV